MKNLGKLALIASCLLALPSATLAESVVGIRVTQSHAREDLNAGLFHDLVRDHSKYNMDAARAAGYDHVIAHPLFAVQIAFFCVEKGAGNWLRSPGAYNPGQKMIFREPFKVGEEITLTITTVDKWIRRGKHYLRDRYDYHNQEGTLKAIWYATLIVPANRAELARIAAL